MNLAMISCEAYSDAWPPFFALLDKFWPDHPPVTLITDRVPSEAILPRSCAAFCVGNLSWCGILEAYALFQTKPFLLLQEDFFLTANVKTELVAAALAQMGPNIGGVRLYPCPGGGVSLESDRRIGIAAQSYRISCQATIWRPQFLAELLSSIGPGSAADFELKGSVICQGTMLAWMRECHPWPIEYLCSAITRGKWTPDAKKLCDVHGIPVDWSRR